MTTHETGRPEDEPTLSADEGPDAVDVDEDDGSVLLTETEPGSVLPPEDEIEEADVVETETTETVELGEPADFDRREVTEVPEPAVAVAAEEAVEPGPLERLEPAATGAPVDPGTGSYEDRWTAIQASFIDDPRRAVESASALVAQLWEEIERSIAVQRQSLEDSWQASERTTDDLRVAMQEYRALYTRFLDLTPQAP